MEYMLQVHLNDSFFSEFTFIYTDQWSYNKLTICLFFCQIYFMLQQPQAESMSMYFWEGSAGPFNVIYPNDTLQRSWWNLETDSWDTHTVTSWYWQ